jgi:hypothetical protein
MEAFDMFDPFLIPTWIDPDAISVMDRWGDRKQTGCDPSWSSLLHLGFFLVYSYAHVGLYQFSTVIHCRLVRAPKYPYAKVTKKIAIVPLAFHLTPTYFFLCDRIRNHWHWLPPPLPPLVALQCSFKHNAPGHHITGNARCTFLEEFK